jgi:hypothetical protein
MTEWVNIVLIRAASVTRWSGAHNLAPPPSTIRKWMKILLSLIQAVRSPGIFFLKEDAIKCRRIQRLLLQYTDFVSYRLYKPRQESLW